MASAVVFARVRTLPKVLAPTVRAQTCLFSGDNFKKRESAEEEIWVRKHEQEVKFNPEKHSANHAKALEEVKGILGVHKVPESVYSALVAW
eukprot:CAMPEP_0114359310 /NCGR_PEP_ID=MMETSP0101-20121206/22911_1 /TAXON_ID=38822 ORGANISM="Pteridomonas danica, Strain PT" /NCGR_SAMPLE_ID=MMETSP0101 /ASSEMBLY_ACC=CAM_ASM_000211 /LENGTH=90 /DNA_ID=CAMNT_0001502769 /DNA_START=14 /DNA_END=283 /DNA_ORIENTATION=+